MLDSREKIVWNEIKTILSADTDLSYIKKVNEGWRDLTADENFPCLYMEPVASPEEPYSTGNRVKINFDLQIIGEMFAYDFDHQIYGYTYTETVDGAPVTRTVKGIMDIANDIKSVLSKTMNLNGKCQSFTFTDTKYSLNEFPFRQVAITMKILLITAGAAR